MGSWTALLDVPPGAEALLLPAEPFATERLSRREVHVLPPGADAGGVGSRWVIVHGVHRVADLPSRALFDEADVAAVVLDGAAAHRSVLSRALSGPRHQRRLVEALRNAGFELHGIYALFRSAQAPVLGFRHGDREAARKATGSHINRFGRGRRRLVRTTRFGVTVRVMQAVAPGTLVIARRASSTACDAPPAALIATEHSGELMVSRGRPAAVDRHHDSVPQADAEAVALAALAAAGVDGVPRLVGRPSPVVVRQSWLPGRPLVVAELSQESLVLWVRRAAAFLGAMHRATAGSDGLVQIHGDFWLGNILTDGGDVVGVVDWVWSSRADPRVDLDFLYAESVRPGLEAAVRTAIEEGYGA